MSIYMCVCLFVCMFCMYEWTCRWLRDWIQQIIYINFLHFENELNLKNIKEKRNRDEY